MNSYLSTALIVLGVAALVAAVSWALAGHWLRHRWLRWRWHSARHDAPAARPPACAGAKRVIVPPALSSLPPPTMSVQRRVRVDEAPTLPMAHVASISAPVGFDLGLEDSAWPLIQQRGTATSYEATQPMPLEALNP